METIETLQTLLPRIKSFGERKAVIALAKEHADEWTYGKLANEAARLAKGLAGAGIEKGQTIALCAEDSPQWMAACLGVVACGAVAVPLDVQLSDKALEHALH